MKNIMNTKTNNTAKNKECSYCDKNDAALNNTSKINAKSDKDLQNIVKNTEDFVYLVNTDRKIVFAFGKYLPHFSKTPDEIIGSVYEAIASAESILIHRIAHENAFNGEAVTYEWFSETLTTINYYHSSLMPVFGKDNRVLSIIASVKNVSGNTKTKTGKMIADRGIKSFSKMLLAIREEEKKKISVALHDELGSLAVSLASILGIMEADIKENKAKNALKGLKNLRTYVEGFIGRVKEMVINLRPPNLDTVGLSGALKDLIILAAKFSSVKLNYNLNIPENLDINEHIRITLYRVVQESLNNILKHANAKNANISIETKDNAVYVNISDDGKGFSFVKKENIRLKNIGILSMKESVEFLGGTFKLKSKPGAGTVISVMCPLASYMLSL